MTEAAAHSHHSRRSIRWNFARASLAWPPIREAGSFLILGSRKDRSSKATQLEFRNHASAGTAMIETGRSTFSLLYAQRAPYRPSAYRLAHC